MKSTVVAPGVYRPAAKPGGTAPMGWPTRIPNVRTNSSSMAIVQPSMVVQLLQCGECQQHNSHAKTCSKYIPPVKKGKRKGTHQPGLNHDDGSGFQQSGSGGDRHQKGLTNQITNSKQKNFYRDIKKN
jgi:hypothetical protein